MFWGFLMLSTDMFDLASGNRFSEHLLPEVINPLWNGMVELGYTSALIGCFLALNRRVLFTPEKLKGKSQLEGNVIPVSYTHLTLPTKRIPSFNPTAKYHLSNRYTWCRLARPASAFSSENTPWFMASLQSLSQSIKE